MASKRSKGGAKASSGSGIGAGSGAGQSRTVAENRKARHRFELLEKVECGIVLVGSEVKSLRENRISLDEAYVRVRDGELYLVGADIPEFRQASVWNHEPRRPRKLLVHRRQLQRLARSALEKGLTIVPLAVRFNPRGLVKVDIATARGKKLHDRREDMKKQDVKRQIERTLRRN